MAKSNEFKFGEEQSDTEFVASETNFDYRSWILAAMQTEEGDKVITLKVENEAVVEPYTTVAD